MPDETPGNAAVDLSTSYNNGQIVTTQDGTPIFKLPMPGAWSMPAILQQQLQNIPWQSGPKPYNYWWAQQAPMASYQNSFNFGSYFPGLPAAPGVSNPQISPRGTNLGLGIQFAPPISGTGSGGGSGGGGGGGSGILPNAGLMPGGGAGGGLGNPAPLFNLGISSADPGGFSFAGTLPPGGVIPHAGSNLFSGEQHNNASNLFSNPGSTEINIPHAGSNLFSGEQHTNASNLFSNDGSGGSQGTTNPLTVDQIRGNYSIQPGNTTTDTSNLGFGPQDATTVTTTQPGTLPSWFLQQIVSAPSTNVSAADIDAMFANGALTLFGEQTGTYDSSALRRAYDAGLPLLLGETGRYLYNGKLYDAGDQFTRRFGDTSLPTQTADLRNYYLAYAKYLGQLTPGAMAFLNSTGGY